MTEEEQADWETRLHGTAIAELVSLTSEIGAGLPLTLLELDPYPAGYYTIGVCTHADAVAKQYVGWNGALSLITNNSVPSGFKWIGELDRGLMQYLYAMWRVGDRWFWFRHPFLDIMHPGMDLYNLALMWFTEALDRWNSGQTAVISRRYREWYNLDTDEFELDPRWK